MPHCDFTRTSTAEHFLNIDKKDTHLLNMTTKNSSRPSGLLSPKDNHLVAQLLGSRYVITNYIFHDHLKYFVKYS